MQSRKRARSSSSSSALLRAGALALLTAASSTGLLHQQPVRPAAPVATSLRCAYCRRGSVAAAASAVMVQQLPERSAHGRLPGAPSGSTAAAPASSSLVRVPRHVAFVLDGNGRWATRQGLPRTAGHIEGSKRALEIIDVCRKLGVQYVTLFAFSTENWRRPPSEVASLMLLLEQSVRANRDAMLANGLRLVVIGQTERLGPRLQALLEQVQEDTAWGGSCAAGTQQQMTVCLAVSYGGRAEIAHAAREVALAVQSGQLRAEDVTEDMLQGYLSTSQAGLPDPDLIIRTSGEQRISNFLLWQAAYSELFVSQKAWPDFMEADLMDALRDFSLRQRRFGGVNSNASAS